MNKGHSSEKSAEMQSRILPANVRAEVKRKLRYRYGSVAEWCRQEGLNYNYLGQFLNGLVAGVKIRAILTKEGILPFGNEEVADDQQ